MKIALYGNPDANQLAHLKKNGFVLSVRSPKFIFVFGGDGSIMKSEQKFPSVPKVIVKKSKICKKCPSLSLEEIVIYLKKKKYTVRKLIKLEVCKRGKCITGVNDVVVHNANPRHAIRYSVEIDGAGSYKEAIGDGIVVATPFGASGYFRSITDSIFYIGIGIAFNNSTESTDHMVVDENARIKVSVTRGPAAIYADNNPKSFLLKEGEEITIRKSKEVFKIVHFGHR